MNLDSTKKKPKELAMFLVLKASDSNFGLGQVTQWY